MPSISRGPKPGAKKANSTGLTADMTEMKAAAAAIASRHDLTAGHERTRGRRKVCQRNHPSTAGSRANDSRMLSSRTRPGSLRGGIVEPCPASNSRVVNSRTPRVAIEGRLFICDIIRLRKD